MRGAVPNGVEAPRGRDERERVAGLERQRFREAPADGDAAARRRNSPSVPCRRLPAIDSIRFMSSPRTPRTSTPLPLYCDEAKAWPSTIGIARRTPGDFASRLATSA